MRPLELSLQGFTSFREEQTLDFRQLDLFAITGPTGAGKSSLLDAMTFALYGTTMRSGKTDAELVSQGATVLKVAFRFMVKQVEHRITRTWRHRPSTPDVKVLLERLDPVGWQTLETRDRAVAKRVEEIVGMDFDTFTRVILLPQGKFDEFLKGDPAKRRELLRQLAGHEVFERMRKAAAEREKSLRGQREGTEAQLAGISAPTDEEVAAREQERATAEADLPRLAEAAAQSTRRLAEESQLMAALQRLTTLRGDLNAVERLGDAIAEQRARLEAARRADRLAGTWALVQASRHHVGLATAAAEAARVRLAGTAAALAEQSDRLAGVLSRQQDLLPQWQAREHLLQEARLKEDQRTSFAEDLAAAARQLAEYDSQVAALTALLATHQQAESKALAATAAAAAAIASHARGGARLATLIRLAPDIATWALRHGQVMAAIAQMEQLGLKLAEANQAKEAAGVACEQATVQCGAARERLSGAKAALEAAVRHDHALAIRLTLENGESCPVCKGTYLAISDLPEGPLGAPATIAPLEGAERAADQKQREAVASLGRIEGQVAALERGRADAARALVADEGALEELTRSLDDALGRDDWQVASLEAERVALQAADERHQKATIDLQEAQAGLRELGQAVGFARENLAATTTARTAAAGEKERHQQRFTSVAEHLRVLTGGQPVAALRQALDAEQQINARALADAQEKAQKAQGVHLQAEEGLKQALAQDAAATATCTREEAAWASALVAATFDEVNFLAARVPAPQQQSWAEAIEAHVQQRVRLAALVAEVAATVGERTTDAAAIASLQEAMALAERQLAHGHEESARLRSWLEGAQARRATAATLLAHQAALLGQEQVFHTLALDLRADAFQAYLLEHLQTELVSRATVLLRELSDGRFALRLQDGDFYVEDNWNGGEIRRVRTLSGGETFATSLAMALALSEKLAMGAELGSLFLDEGFGTLDADTLESVTQILESLRQHNRLIGVITHVRALGDRLPTQVRVRKSPSGSTIEVEAL